MRGAPLLWLRLRREERRKTYVDQLDTCHLRLVVVIQLALEVTALNDVCDAVRDIQPYNLLCQNWP